MSAEGARLTPNLSGKRTEKIALLCGCFFGVADLFSNFFYF